MIITISIVKGKDKGLVKEFSSLPISIGRFPDNDYILSDPLVSRRHSMLYLDENKLTICDIDSTNGIYLNKERLLEPRHVSNDDFVILGKTILQLKIITND